MTTTAPALVPRAFPVPGAGAAAVGGALLLAVTNTLVAALGPARSTADVVRLAGERPVLTEVAILTGLLASLLLVPGVWRVAAVLAHRAPRTAAAAAWMTSSAYVLFVALSVESATALSLATSGQDSGAYAAAVDEQTPAVMLGAYAVFGIDALAGVVLLGICALRRGSAVPVWAAWALLLSAPVRVAGLALGVAAGPTIASLLMVLGFVGVLSMRHGRPVVHHAD